MFSNPEANPKKVSRIDPAPKLINPVSSNNITEIVNPSARPALQCPSKNEILLINGGIAIAIRIRKKFFAVSGIPVATPRTS